MIYLKVMVISLIAPVWFLNVGISLLLAKLIARIVK
jgi:hypothetical protein